MNTIPSLMGRSEMKINMFILYFARFALPLSRKYEINFLLWNYRLIIKN